MGAQTPGALCKCTIRVVVNTNAAYGTIANVAPSWRTPLALRLQMHPLGRMDGGESSSPGPAQEPVM